MKKIKYYRCASCGFAYTEQKTARQCEAWCLKHHSCNMEITRKAVKIQIKKRLPIQIEGIVFRRKDNKIDYLLLKRTFNRGGFWQPITGGLEKGENLIECLKREIKEETGLKEIIRIIEDVHYFEFLDLHLIKEYVFGVEVSPTKKIIIDRREHSTFKWCTFEKAIKLMKWEENKKALEKLNNILSAS